MKPFVRINIVVNVDLVVGGKPVKQYQRKAKLIAPERKLADEMLQDSLIETAAERTMDLLDEINYEFETSNKANS